MQIILPYHLIIYLSNYFDSKTFYYLSITNKYFYKKNPPLSLLQNFIIKFYFDLECIQSFDINEYLTQLEYLNLLSFIWEDIVSPMNKFKSFYYIKNTSINLRSIKYLTSENKHEFVKNYLIKTPYIYKTTLHIQYRIPLYMVKYLSRKKRFDLLAILN